MRDFEELELDPLAGQDLEDGESLEDFEDFEAFEDLEDFEEFEDLEEEGEGGYDPELWESAEFDPFIGSALRRVRRALPGVLSNPLLKRMAHMGAGALGQAIGGRQGGAMARAIAGQVLREASLEGDYEQEGDFEGDFEAIGGDMEVLYEMQRYANRAAKAKSKDEVDQFIPVIAGLASKLLPKAVPLIGRGIGALGRLFGRRRRSRPLLRTLPRIAAQAATHLARRPATPQRVIGAMSRSLGQTLASRQRAAAAMRPPSFGPGYPPYAGYAPRAGYGPHAGFGRPPAYGRRRRFPAASYPGMRW